MTRQAVDTKNAPRAIGAYSQAIRTGSTVYLSGQIALDPETMQMAEGIDAQIRRALDNLQAVAAAAGGTLDDIVKLTIYLTDLGHFPRVNDIMADYFRPPYPARATIGISSLPRNALIEIEAVLSLP